MALDLTIDEIVTHYQMLPHPEGGYFKETYRSSERIASRLAADSSFSLVGCTVAPGFDFADFELAKANILVQDFPQHASLIRELCRI